MGLLSKITGMVAPARKPTDDVHLAAAMLIMAGADGSIDAGEIMTVSGFAATLPEFKGKDFNRVAEEAIKAVRRHKSLDEAVGALGDLSTQALKTKCFVLCADIALSSGDVDEKEDALLEKLQGVLGVDQQTAAKVIEVLSLKYAR